MAPDNKIPDIATAMTRLAADTVYPEGKDPVRVTSAERPRKMALVLSGGGASGAFEAGVMEETMKAMEAHNEAHPDNPLKFDVVIGTSTGSLNTYGLLLNELFRKGLLAEPEWLAARPGKTLNFRLWKYLASFKWSSKFVLDKTWLLRLLQGAGTWSGILTWIMLLVITPLLLIGAFVLPDILKIGSCVGNLPSWAGWAAGGAALLAVCIVCLILWKNMGMVQRSGRPVLVSFLFLFPSFFVLGCLQDILAVMVKSHPLDNFLGYGIALLFIPVLVILILLSVSGDALFGNSRLKRLVAAIADSAHGNGDLRSAVSRNTAQSCDRSISATVHTAWNEAKDTLPTCIFTATNISAEKQGLFLLGSDEDCARLATGHWLPIRIGAQPPRGGSVPPEQLITGVIASTAIPATYPPEIIDYRYESDRRHIFVDGGVLDFAAYHAAIDLGCTHILAMETDSMRHDLMKKHVSSGWFNLFSNAAATSFTGSDEEAREEAARIAKTNRRVVYEGLESKHLVLFCRIAPSENERMIDSSEFNGRFRNGKRVNSLDDWIAYGQHVNPAAGVLPDSIWYRDPNGEWQENRDIKGPIIWDASFLPSPQS